MKKIMKIIIWMVNNSRNIFVSGNSQKYHSKIIITYANEY